MQKGDISNALPKRYLVHADLVRIETPEIKKALGFIPVIKKNISYEVLTPNHINNWNIPQNSYVTRLKENTPEDIKNLVTAQTHNWYKTAQHTTLAAGKPHYDWHSVNWTQSSHEIAQHLGCTVRMVDYMRSKLWRKKRFKRPGMHDTIRIHKS